MQAVYEARRDAQRARDGGVGVGAKNPVRVLPHERAAMRWQVYKRIRLSLQRELREDAENLEVSGRHCLAEAIGYVSFVENRAEERAQRLEREWSEAPKDGGANE